MAESEIFVMKHIRKTSDSLLSLNAPTKISRIVNIDQAILET